MHRSPMGDLDPSSAGASGCSLGCFCRPGGAAFLARDLLCSIEGSIDPMKLEELIEDIDARVLQPGVGRKTEIARVFAGDKMSTLLERAGPETMLVTSLANTQLACVAELMDCPALCLVDGAEPDPKLLEAAARADTAVVVSTLDMFETCGRLHRRLYRDDFQGSR